MRLTDLGHTVRLDVDGLTDAQRAALAIDRELVVTAGAGAGKTHVLSLRYVALLLALAATGDDDVERVVVLTFTDKAAHEMAERCHRTLLQVIAAARVQVPRIVPALERIEDRFDRARIGTFHGFCARILREFPAETGTPPGSTPLPPGEARVWIDQALDDALVAHLAATPSDVVPLLDAFGSRAGLVDAGRVALDRLGILDEVLADHAADRVDLAQAVAEARPTADEARAWIDGVGLPSLQLLRRLTAPSGGGPFVTRTLIPALDALSAETSPAPADDPLAVYARYREVLEVLITDAGTVRSLDHHTVLGTRDTWPDERRYKLAKEASKVLIARLGDWGARAEAARLLPTSADRALLAALGPFARWVRAAAARLGVTLTRQRKLTFEELQRRAIRVVVGDERLRTTLRDRFRYLMVDEFQDTDGPQWTLVRALARANPAVPEDRLFLVGDPKQAIYGFRGGDVSVFRRAIDELGVDPIVLPDNFRSRPTLIDWFNRTFPSILGPEAPYAPLVARRPDPGGQVVQLRVADADQAEATARWIAAALVDDPGRIAILLRSRTRQARYEAALRAHHVPYVVVSGVGFWTRPEVVDAVNWVRALAVGDPLSIVGALRSPLGALLDAEVAEVAAAGWRHPGLAPWLALRHAVPPSALIRALAGAALPAVTLDDPSGRAAANLERLAAWVAPFDGLGLGQVADRLAAEVDAERREAEATLVPTEARVVVCTVHAAKGLEFPVVVVPELGARPSASVPPLLVARLDGDRFRIASRVLDPDADVQVRVRPGLYSALAEALRREQDAEERRLLYVACTRARDTLVLIGPPAPDAEPGSRMTWVQLVDRTAGPSAQVPPAVDARPAPIRVPPPGTAAPPVPTTRALELSPSALDRFASCPARWMRRDLLGIPEAPATARDRRLALAAARGQVVHHVLEDGVHADPAAIRTRWAAAARAVAATADELDQGLIRVEAHVAATIDASEVRRALAAPGWSELPFRATHAGVALRGRIDRLWFDAEAGGHVVLDWKSDALLGRPPDTVADTHAVQVAGYAWAADRVLVARGAPGVVRTEIVLTERGVVVARPWTDADRARIPDLLERAADTTARPWDDVERDAIRAPRPCASCGFRGFGCRGSAHGDEG